MILRKIDNKDCQLLFNWANDVEVRKNAFNAEPIKWEDHVKWFTSRIDDPDTKLFILEKEETPVGQIRFDKEENYWKIDYSIEKKFRGLGMGKKIIELGLKEVNGEIKAWVKKENRASMKVFENLGFQKENKDDGTIIYSLSK